MSGVLSAFASFCLAAFVFSWLPGLLFGLLVMLPWAMLCRLAPIQAIAVTGLSCVGYFVAVEISLRSDYYLAPVGGAVGTTIMLAPVLIGAPHRARVAAVWAIILGGLVAWVFVVPNWVDAPWLLWAGIVLWQAVVSVPLAAGLPSDLPAAAARRRGGDRDEEGSRVRPPR
jgi:hypothetical protein